MLRCSLSAGSCSCVRGGRQAGVYETSPQSGQAGELCSVQWSKQSCLSFAGMKGVAAQ